MQGAKKWRITTTHTLSSVSRLFSLVVYFFYDCKGVTIYRVRRTMQSPASFVLSQLPSVVYCHCIRFRTMYTGHARPRCVGTNHHFPFVRTILGLSNPRKPGASRHFFTPPLSQFHHQSPTLIPVPSGGACRPTSSFSVLPLLWFCSERRRS